MCFKRVTDFKILLSIITLFLWVTNVCATSKLIEGPQLKEPLTIDLDFSDTDHLLISCLLYTSPSPRDATLSRMPSSA